MSHAALGGSGTAGGSLNDMPPHIFVDGSAPATPTDASTSSCARTASAETALEPVHLAFAFDVSGSMGKLDFPYHDPKLKWEPVVAATKGFFTDKASANLFASLVFSPIDESESVGVIRETQLSCDFEIPKAPAGQSFDPARTPSPATPVGGVAGGLAMRVVLTGIAHRAGRADP
jgi:hypothetical protein